MFCHFRHDKTKDSSNAVEDCVILARDLPDLEKDIYGPIDEAIRTCRSTVKVSEYVEIWVEKNLKDKDEEQSRDELRNYMETTFPFMTYMAVVYHPMSGGKNHWTDYTPELKWFRYTSLVVHGAFAV